MIGRYHRVRPIGPRGIGAPYVWDRGRAQDAPRLIPAPYDKGERFKGFTRYGEWWRSPEGIWTPTLAGGSYINAGQLPRTFLARAGVAAAQSTFALDSNYVNGVSGDAIAGRLSAPSALILSKVYAFITSYTGTAANVNDLNFEFRDHSNTTGPSTTLHDSVTLDPASATGWVSATWGTGFTLVADTYYWAILGDADGNGTDNATVLRSIGSWSLNAEASPYVTATTTDGWSATRTLTSTAPSLFLLFTNGRTLGVPFSSQAASTNGTQQRGLRFIAPVSCLVFGMVINSTAGGAGLGGINLWSGANGPGGTADVGVGTQPLGNTGSVNPANEFGFAFGTPPTITQGTTYRLVFSYASNQTYPQRFQIGTGADATLRSAMIGGGEWYWTEASGTTDWSNDNTSEFPAVDIIVEDFVTAAGAGGGLRLAGHGGLAA